MRPDGPTSFWLNGAVGWRRHTLRVDGIATPDVAGLRLTADPRGPLALGAPDGSLGGLVLPRGVAVDADGLVYLLSPNDLLVRRFSPEREAFVVLEEVGGRGDGVRRFQKPLGIAVARRSFAVADAHARRLSVFSLDTWALLDVIEWPDGTPVDVCADRDRFFILDGARPRIYGCDARPIGFDLLLDGGATAGPWTRIAVDRAGRLYVLERRTAPVLRVFERRVDAGRERWVAAGEVADAGVVADRFTAPGIRVDDDGLVRLPASLLRPCARELPVARWGLTGTVAATPPPARRDVRVLDVAGRRYVVDRAGRRVEMFLGGGRKRRHVWGPWDADERPVASTAEDAWEPVDLAASHDLAYVLDRRHARVYAHRAGRETLRVVLHDPDAAERWGRLVVDEHGGVGVLDEARGVVRRMDANGVWSEVEAPAFPPTEPLADEAPGETVIAVDFEGRKHAVDPYRGGAGVWTARGEWISTPLDSRIHDCLWDRISIAFGDLPPGCSVEIWTATANAGDRPPTEWQLCATVVAPLQQPPDARGLFPAPPADCLVQSSEGRFLWLRLQLRGDGRLSPFPAVAGDAAAGRTPVVDAIRVHYPRQTLLAELPALFAYDAESRPFLDRLLTAFRVEFDRFDTAIDDAAALLDPRAVPEGRLLDFLAGWLAVEFEGDWSWAQKRRLLTVMPRVLARRGRPDGLRILLAAYLSNVSGVPLAEIERLQFPKLLEGFRERTQRRLTVDGWRLGEDVPLAAPPYARRLRLDEPSSADGDGELISVGTPDTDWAAAYAHRFRVFVPAAFVRSASAEQTLRRAIEAEKPAHTRYDLCLVPSLVQVGIQSTLGVDMIVGEPPRMQLGGGPDASSAAPGAPPRNVLGRTALLGGRHAGRAPFALDGRARTGRETVLT